MVIINIYLSTEVEKEREMVPCCFVFVLANLFHISYGFCHL